MVRNCCPRKKRRWDALIVLLLVMILALVVIIAVGIGSVVSGNCTSTNEADKEDGGPGASADTDGKVVDSVADV